MTWTKKTWHILRSKKQDNEKIIKTKRSCQVCWPSYRSYGVSVCGKGDIPLWRWRESQGLRQDDWFGRGTLQHPNKKKIWHQTVSLLREECPRTEIGTLTGLFGYSRQSFYCGLDPQSHTILILTTGWDAGSSPARHGENVCIILTHPPIRQDKIE